MPRLAWLTDLHLNMITRQDAREFVDLVVGEDPDAVLVGGDTAEAGSVAEGLEMLAEQLGRPIYFVLGNHDYYGGSIAGVRSIAEKLARESLWLTWLPAAGMVELTPSVGLIGHGGWADGRFGNYRISPGLLNDYVLIDEFRGFSDDDRLRLLHKLGDEAAAHFRRFLPEAMERYAQVILLTHVPPFRQACWHEGAISDDEHLPHFSCRVAGEVLLEEAHAHLTTELTVLCGHTHSDGQAQMSRNLHVLTGRARYGMPEVQRIIGLPSG